MNTLRPPKRSPKNHLVSAFDVETLGPDRKFVCGCFQDADGQRFTRCVQELRSWLLAATNAGGIVYATNLFYDFTATFGGFPAPCKALFTGARLIRVHWKVPKQRVIRFYDTSNLTNRMPVSRLGEMVGVAKLATPPFLLEPDNFDLTPGDLPPVRMAEIEKYNRRDTDITYRWSLRFQSVCKELGCEVKTTIASTAMDLWKREYMQKGLMMPPPWMNEWFREAYHGGLVFVFKRGLAKDVTYYDIKSLYPYVLANRPYPDCGSIRYIRDGVTIANIMEYEGFSRAVVDYPDAYFPILPVVVEGCLLTCTGRYSGLWTHFELRESLKRGATIVEVLDQCIFTRTVAPLRAYMEALYKLRIAAQEEGDGFEGVYKLFMNALSGKFGQRYDSPLYEPIDVDGIRDPAELEGLLTVSAGNFEYYLREKRSAYDPDFVNVPWAAYMTAYARMHEIEALEEGFPDVFACDTDSVFTTHRYNLGDDLGDMDIKEAARDWVFLYPKQYASWESNGEWMGKVKGVPKRGQDQFIRTGSYTWSKPTTFKEAIREGVTPGDWVESTRTDRPKHDKRVYYNDVDPYTQSTDSRPFTIDEAAEYFSVSPGGEPWRLSGIIPATDPLRESREALARIEREIRIEILRESCTIPSDIVFRLWDYKRHEPRRVRLQGGLLTTWDKGVVDDIATEYGYDDDELFLSAIAQQVDTYAQIRELEGQR